MYPAIVVILIIYKTSLYKHESLPKNYIFKLKLLANIAGTRNAIENWIQDIRKRHGMDSPS